ncbi:MAG: hypothetical protein ACE37K_18080 [Planctomycetota bacterium]
MSQTPRLSGEAFALERLRQNPELDYEAMRSAGEQAGVTVLPIQFGRARRQLGLTGVAATPAKVQAPEIEAPEIEAPEIEAPEIQAPKAQVEPEQVELAADAVAEAPTSLPAAPATTQPTQPATPASKTTPKPGPGLSRPSTPAFEFLVEELRAQPTISYGELKNRADDKGLKIAPIMYGRAKALLGLVPVRPRGQGKNRKKATVTGLPRAEAASAEQFARQIETVRDIDDLVAIVKQLDAERRRLRAALDSIAGHIDEALS